MPRIYINEEALNQALQQFENMIQDLNHNKGVVSNVHNLLLSSWSQLGVGKKAIDGLETFRKDIGTKMEELKSDKHELKSAIDLFKALDQSYDYIWDLNIKKHSLGVFFCIQIYILSKRIHLYFFVNVSSFFSCNPEMFSSYFCNLRIVYFRDGVFIVIC